MSASSFHVPGRVPDTLLVLFVFVKVTAAFPFLCLPRFLCRKVWEADRWSVNERGPAPRTRELGEPKELGEPWAKNTNESLVKSVLFGGLSTIVLFICPQLLIGALVFPYPNEKNRFGDLPGVTLSVGGPPP